MHGWLLLTLYNFLPLQQLKHCMKMSRNGETHFPQESYIGLWTVKCHGITWTHPTAPSPPNHTDCLFFGMLGNSHWLLLKCVCAISHVNNWCHEWCGYLKNILPKSSESQFIDVTRRISKQVISENYLQLYLNPVVTLKTKNKNKNKF